MKRHNTIPYKYPKKPFEELNLEETQQIIKKGSSQLLKEKPSLTNINIPILINEKEEEKEFIEFVLGDFHDFHKIDELQYFKRMTSLSIVNDLIEDMGTIIENIPNKDAMIYLCLNENYIKTIKNIEYLPNLKQLHLNFNFIEKIDYGVSKVISLKQFWICDNKIKKIENIPEHINNFWIANNYIEELPNDFDKYKQIENLNISGNCLTDFNNIYILKKLPNLKILYLNNCNYGENPICSFYNYKMMMIHLFENIEILDQYKITYDERIESENSYLKKTVYYKNKIRDNRKLIKNIIQLLKGHLLFYKGIKYNYIRLYSIQQKINKYKLYENENSNFENTKNSFYKKDKALLNDKIKNEIKEIEINKKKFNKIKQHISDLNDLSIVINFYEIESFGNYKIEPGNLDSKWVKSCLDLLELKISNEFLERNNFKINYNRIFKINNKKSKLIFDSLYDDLIDINGKFGIDKNFFDYYFLIFPKEKLSYRKVFQYIFEKKESEKEKILTDNISFIDELYLNKDKTNKNFVAIICKCINFDSMIEKYKTEKNFESVNEIIKEIKSLKNKKDITKLVTSNEECIYHYKIGGAVEPFYLIEYEYIENEKEDKKDDENNYLKDNNKSKEDVFLSSFNEEVYISYDHNYNFNICCKELCSNENKQFFSRETINKYFNKQFNNFEELDDGLIFFAKNTIFNYLKKCYKYDSLKEFKDEIDKITQQINEVLSFNVTKTEKKKMNDILNDKDKLSEIKFLNLCNNELSNSEFQEYINQLQEFIEIDSKILSFTKRLEILILSNNNIESVNLSLINELFPNLKEIDLSHNNINTIKYESKQPSNNVVKFDISFNNINDFTYIILILKQFNSLNTFIFFGNPFDKYCEENFAQNNLLNHNLTKEMKMNIINEFDKYFKNKNSIKNPLSITQNTSNIKRETLNFLYIYEQFSFCDKYKNFSENPYFREKIYQNISLKTVNLTRKKLLSIPTIQNGRNTQVLILNLNKIQKINNLNQMPNLLELYLQNNKISKIENLPKNLLKLDLSYNELKSLDDLSKAYNLEWLNIDCNLIEKLDEVIGLSNLIEFYCSGNKINNIKECYKLSKLKKLEIIDLFDNDVCNNNEEIRINMINNCPNLRIFNRILIDKNEKSKTKDLFAGKLTNNILEKRLGSGNSTKNIIDLDLSGLKLKEQICLFSKENYPNLRTLNLSKNNFKSFNIFGMLPNLKELNLDFNNFVEAISKKDKIINGKGIMGLPNLEKLEMSNNQLINLNGIQYFKNLKTLILRDNNFSKIESLHHMNELNYLDVSHNKIDNVDKVCLGELPFLQMFICDDNIIKNINGLTKFESIKFLSCQNNKINDINCLDRLSCLKKLKEILLKGNPISKDYYYRENLIQLIPNLIKIDGRTIIEEERENSKINLNERKSNFNNLYFKQNNLINKVLTNKKMIRRVNHNSIGENAKSLLSLPQITTGKPIISDNNKVVFNGINNKNTYIKFSQRLNSNVPFKINGKKK